jgi:flagellin
MQLSSATSVPSNALYGLNSLYRSMKKMASGDRIGHAGEDPAGLAISERLFSVARNNNSAISNLQNSLSYLQTADGWMGPLTSMMGQMSELAVLANDGTKSISDRTLLQKEFNQLQRQISDITTGPHAAATFNGQQLFQEGSGTGIVSGDMNLSATNHAEIGSVTTYTYDDNQQLTGSSHTAVTWDSLIADNSLDISTPSGAADALAQLTIGLDHLNQTRASLGADMKKANQSIAGLMEEQENLMDTHSRIRNTDVAFESTRQTQAQMQLNIGLAMLAQSKNSSANILHLLQ